MRFVWALAFLFMLAEIRGAEPASVPPAQSNTATNSAEADAEWAAIVKASRAPEPPADWNGKAPTQQAEMEFKRKMGDMAEAVANRAKEFYEKYPSHAQSNEARSREKHFRAQAEKLREVALPDKPAEPARKRDPEFEAIFAEVIYRARAARPKGMEAFIIEVLNGGFYLAQKFPKEPEGWELLVPNVRYLSPEGALPIYRMMYTNGPPEIREFARPEIKRFEMVGKPVSFSYKSTDGQEVSMAKLKGKVVLINFWATWCPPCVASIPELQALYDKHREQGFEIVGVSMDEDCEELQRFVRKNKVSWPQYCYGPDKMNAIQQQFEVRVTPSLYLVDKKGILRDINARDGLPGKIEAMLKE